MTNDYKIIQQYTCKSEGSILLLSGAVVPCTHIVRPWHVTVKPFLKIFLCHLPALPIAVRTGSRTPGGSLVQLPLHAPQHALAIIQWLGLVPHHDIHGLQGAVRAVFSQEADQLHLVRRRRLLLEVVHVGILAQLVIPAALAEFIDWHRCFGISRIIANAIANAIAIIAAVIYIFLFCLICHCSNVGSISCLFFFFSYRGVFSFVFKNWTLPWKLGWTFNFWTFIFWKQSRFNIAFFWDYWLGFCLWVFTSWTFK